MVANRMRVQVCLDHEDVRHHDIVVGELHVGGGVEYDAGPGQLDRVVEQELQASRDRLMVRAWRRCHVVLPIDDLVDVVVVRQQQVVVVGQLDRRPGENSHQRRDGRRTLPRASICRRRRDGAAVDIASVSRPTLDV